MSVKHHEAATAEKASKNRAPRKLLLVVSLLFTLNRANAQEDNLTIDYIKLLNINITALEGESFHELLKARYHPLGNLIELTTSGDQLFKPDKLCFRFDGCPMRWFCYTPYEAESKLMSGIRPEINCKTDF